MPSRDDGRNLLGFDSPLNSHAPNLFITFNVSRRQRFPNAIQDWVGTPRTLRERSMIAFMDSITDKPEWNQKINDERIVQRWRAEAAELEKSQAPERALTSKMFEYCILELRDYARVLASSHFIPAIDSDAAVYKSDLLIPDQLRRELQEAALPLERIPKKLRDWHPGSDELVLDLVHPSLFPLLYGRSRILSEGLVSLHNCDAEIGKGEIIPIPKPEHVLVDNFPGLYGSWDSRHGNGKQYFYSSRFQWLPCEVAFRDNNAVEITSYINNLHPKKHKALYKVLEKIIPFVIPMWDATLASTERTNIMDPNVRIKFGSAEYHDPARSRPTTGEEAEQATREKLAQWRQWHHTTAQRLSELDDDEREDFEHELDQDWETNNRILVMPEPEDYPENRQYEHPKLDEGEINPRVEQETTISKIGLRDIFANQGLQVIVKLANIHLTPDKPSYAGGAWHVEGQLNEHICASALYYYDSSNISHSYLSFREATNVERFGSDDYEQDDYAHLERMYDIEQDGAAQQYLGKVNTREGRILTFPNVLHHRVEPFQLEDVSRPGHRKILALFLVDPYCRIPSTANVPPQQKEWWREMVQSLDRVNALPVELAEHIVDSAGDFPINLEEAKEIRLDLMAERKIYVEDVESRMNTETFSFCEH